MTAKPHLLRIGIIINWWWETSFCWGKGGDSFGVESARTISVCHIAVEKNRQSFGLSGHWTICTIAAWYARLEEDGVALPRIFNSSIYILSKENARKFRKVPRQHTPTWPFLTYSHAILQIHTMRWRPALPGLSSHQDRSLSSWSLSSASPDSETKIGKRRPRMAMDRSTWCG